MFKKVISFICVTVLLLASVTEVTASANVVGFDFPQFRGESGSEGIIDAKTPITAETTAEKYAKKFGDTWNDFPGTPVVAVDSVYCLVAGQNKLYRINKDTASVIATAQCEGLSQFFSMIAYGDGKIFVPRSAQIDGKNSVVVCAYDSQTLSQLWVSEAVGNPEDGNSPLGSITYNDGYIYLGVSNNSGTQGSFACFSAADEDVNSSDETKTATWQYIPENGLKAGYYWCGGTVAGDAFVFGGEATELVSHSLTDNTVYDRFVLEENSSGGIRSTVYYDEVTRKVFATTKSGYIYSVKLNADNTFDASSVMKTNLGGTNTSSPVVFGGRVYVGGGGFASKSGFSVLKADDLSMIYQITDFKSQSSPVLTTAYANGENGKVVIYLTDYQTSKLYAVTDQKGQTEPKFEVVATPSVTQYCSQSIAADGEGNIYFYNDSGALFCFGQKNSDDAKYTAEDIENQIDLYAAQPVTVSMRKALERIKTRMADLENPSDVKNADALQKMIADVNALSDEKETVKRLNSELSALDCENVTLEDDLKVTNWLASYNGLSEENKAEVAKAYEMLAAAEKIQQLKNAAAIADINKQIEELPNEKNLTLKDEAAVKAVAQILSSQNDDVKRGVDSTKLDNLTLKLAALHTAVDTLDKAIDSQLDPVLITEKHRSAVTSLTADYNSLSEADRTFVKNAETLFYAQRVLAGFDRGVIIAEVFESLYGTDLIYTYEGNGLTLTFKGSEVTDITSDYVIGANKSDIANSVPATGDTQKPWKWIIITAVCVVVLAASLIIIKKGKR